MPADPASDPQIMILVVEDEAGIEGRILSPHSPVEQEASGNHGAHFDDLPGRSVLRHLAATRNHLTQEMAVRPFILDDVSLVSVKHPRHGGHDTGTTAERCPQLEGTVGRDRDIIVHKQNELMPSLSKPRVAGRCRAVILIEPQHLNLWITLFYQSTTAVGRSIINQDHLGKAKIGTAHGAKRVIEVGDPVVVDQTETDRAGTGDLVSGDHWPLRRMGRPWSRSPRSAPSQAQTVGTRSMMLWP